MRSKFISILLISTSFSRYNHFQTNNSYDQHSQVTQQLISHSFENTMGIVSQHVAAIWTIFCLITLLSEAEVDEIELTRLAIPNRIQNSNSIQKCVVKAKCFQQKHNKTNKQFLTKKNIKGCKQNKGNLKAICTDKTKSDLN